MKLDKYKIKKNKLGFFFVCVFLLIGLSFIVPIFDIMTETVEIEAVVSHTFETNSTKAGRVYSPGGPKMNIEWVDLNGETQTVGSLYNRGYLEEGDTYTILVDAETQSRRLLTKGASIACFVLGLCFVLGALGLMKCAYCREEYEDY